MVTCFVFNSLCKQQLHHKNTYLNIYELMDSLLLKKKTFNSFHAQKFLIYWSRKLSFSQNLNPNDENWSRGFSSFRILKLEVMKNVLFLDQASHEFCTHDDFIIRLIWPNHSKSWSFLSIFWEQNFWKPFFRGGKKLIFV